MKKFLALLIISAILFAGLYCSKTNSPGNNNNNNNNNNNSKDTTPPSAVGVPTGPTISKFIGPAGGSLATADGRIQIDIPNGALPNGDTITIQNITNSMQSGLGDAYNFLPNGLKFSVPITIKFNYADSDMVNTDPQLFRMAYQDSLHFWKPISLVSLDTIGHSFTSKTDHFTGYSGYTISKFTIVAGKYNARKQEIMVGDFVTCAPLCVSPHNAGYMVPFEKQNVLNTYTYTVNDIVGGNSTYGTMADATAANSGITGGVINNGYWAFTFTAPAKVPPDNNPVEAIVYPFDAYVTLRDPVTGDTTHPIILRCRFIQKIKIIGPPLYRIDIVDWEDLSSGGTVNYYDSASIFVSVNQNATQYYKYTISQDSVMNFPPVAWPTTPTVGAGGCTYTWIPEPIGTVNITNASATILPLSVTSAGNNGQFLVNVSVDNTGANTAWAQIQCKGAAATVNKDAKPDYNIPIPFNIDISDTSFNILLEGTVDQDHIRVKRVKDTK